VKGKKHKSKPVDGQSCAWQMQILVERVNKGFDEINRIREEFGVKPGEPLFGLSLKER